MIEQNVQVVRCNEQRIFVRMGSQSGCSACDNGHGCGAGVFARLLQRKPAIIELARRDIDVRPGQMVTLAFSEQVYLKVVLAYYGWPLVAGLIGAFAGYSLGARLQFGALALDAFTLLGGMLAGGMAMRFLKRQKNTDAVLDALQMAVYYPSATPDMCNGAATEFERD